MRCRSIAADYIHTIVHTCYAYTGIEFFDMFNSKALRYAKRHCNLPRLAVHGIYIRKIHHSGFVAKVLQWYICQIEVDIFEQQVCCHEDVAVCSIVEYGCVITNAHRGRCVGVFEAFGETVDKAEFA